VGNHKKETSVKTYPIPAEIRISTTLIQIQRVTSRPTCFVEDFIARFYSVLHEIFNHYATCVQGERLRGMYLPTRQESSVITEPLSLNFEFAF
jgi:hypothetical protein